MLTYPKEIPAEVWARLDRVIAEGELACAAAAGAPARFVDFSDGSFAYTGEHPEANVTAIRAAVTAIAAIVEELPDEPRVVIDGLIDQALTGFGRYHSGTVEAFRARVLQDVHASSSWSAFLQRRRPMTPPASAPIAPSAPSVDDPLFTLAEAAEKLGCSKATVSRMGKRGKLKIIKITPRLHKVSLSEIKRARKSPEFRDR